MNCVDAIREVFSQEIGVINTAQVVDRIYTRYTDEPWKKSTITAHLMGLSVNHSSSITIHPSGNRPFSLAWVMGVIANGSLNKTGPGL